MSAATLVLLLAAFLFVCNIWGYDLWTPDEPFFAEGAREMIVDGHWLVSHVNGIPNNHKPPLFFWLIALASLPMGEVLAFTARLPSVLAALTTVAVTLGLGRRFACERTAVLGAFILATSLLFWNQARSAQTDAVLCMFIWIALAAFVSFRAGESDGHRAGRLFWTAAALAVLTKGPVGLLLPLGVVIVTLAADGDSRRLRHFAPIAGPLLFLFVCGLWLAAARLYGPAEYSVWGALREHFVDRAVHGLHHIQPFWYYGKVLPPQLMPWTFLVPGSLLLAWTRRDRTDRFLLATLAVVILGFSASTEKRTLYLLPAFPAFAMLVARLVGTVVGWEPSSRLRRGWFTAGQALLGLLATLIGLAVPVAAQRVEEVSGWVVWFVAGLFVATGISTLVVVWRERLLAAAVLPGAGFAALYLIAAIVVLPRFDSRKSGRDFALTLAERTVESRAAGHPVLTLDLGNLPVQFALFSNGLYTVEVQSPDDVARHFSSEDRVFAVVNAKHIDALPASSRRRMKVIAATHASRRDVVLLANRSRAEASLGNGTSSATVRPPLNPQLGDH